MISQIELLLNYCNRFYKHQFITRKAVNNDLLQKMEDILDDYLALAVSILSIAVGIMVLFPQTFFIGNVINAIMILLIMALSLRVGNIKIALIEIPFLLIPLLLIWLGHPLKQTN